MLFFLHLGTVQERYRREKRSLFYSGTESLKTRDMDKLSVDYFIHKYAADAIGMTRFGVFVIIGALSRHQKCTN